MELPHHVEYDCSTQDLATVLTRPFQLYFHLLHSLLLAIRPSSSLGEQRMGTCDFVLTCCLSEISPRAAQIMTTLLPQYIDGSCYRIVNGAAEVVTALLEHPYGHIIYTGNGTIGKIVMAAASKHLTPVTLELGGKSPVIVSSKANVHLAAKRTAWGKFFNAGQTCMCPDYALVERSVLPEFIKGLKTVSQHPYPPRFALELHFLTRNQAHETIHNW
jgi:Aldehyde dehydrogenase family